MQFAVSWDTACDILALIRPMVPPWLELPDLCAFISVESSFNTNAKRFEPRLNECSYGLMQLLLSTARFMGFQGEPEQLFIPQINVPLGIKYLGWSWEQLEKKLKRPPTKDEWVASYNEGVEGVVRGRKVPGYVSQWYTYQNYWRATLQHAMTVRNA